MRKLNKKEILLGVLVVALFLILGFQFRSEFTFNSNMQVRPNDTSNNTSINQVPNKYLVLLQEYQESKLNSLIKSAKQLNSGLVLKRDPFEKPNSKRFTRSNSSKVKKKSHDYNGKKSLRLNGIIWDEEKPSAIISNKIVYVGSWIGSYEVSEILPRRVLLKSNNNSLVLELYPNQVGKK